MTVDVRGTVPAEHGSLFGVIKERPPLDRSASTPLWIQLKNAISEAIRMSGARPDSRLPSEQALCGLFGVSRPIVRLALDALVSEGLVAKIARQGVFVRRPHLDADFASSNTGLFGEMIAKGHVVTTRILHRQRADPSERERSALRLPARSDVFRLTRVYSVDGAPVSVSHLVLAGYKTPGIEALAVENHSIYALLRERYGFVVASSERWFEAVTAAPEQARLLAVDANAPIVLIESVGCLADGTPLEFYRSFFNTRQLRIHVTATSEARATSR